MAKKTPKIKISPSLLEVLQGNRGIGLERGTLENLTKLGYKLKPPLKEERK